jgi:hypothetical protein
MVPSLSGPCEPEIIFDLPNMTAICSNLLEGRIRTTRQLAMPHIPQNAFYFPRPLAGWESDEMNFILEETTRPYN